MNFLKNLFGGSRGSDDRMLPIYVMSHRCREPIEGKVDLFNELSNADEGGGYYVRKVLHTSGEKRCFDQVEVEIWFNGKKGIADHTVSGGRWLTAEEYAEELAIFNAPPEEEEEIDAEVAVDDDDEADADGSESDDNDAE